MKKNSLIILFFTLTLSCSTQTNSHDDILKNTNIKEIEEYLTKTHPEDPKKRILQSKLIALKNKEWTKGAANAKPMEVRPIISDIPQNFSKNSLSRDSEEFKKLTAETSSEHKDKTVKLLNAMFSEDINSKEAILLFRNNSDCNLVLNISGKKFYNLAVASHNENFIIVDKDLYSISGNICDVRYDSQKQITKNIQIILTNPEYKRFDENEKLALNKIDRDINNKSSTKKTILAKKKQAKKKS
ncbi:hypothetical protein CHRY9390_01864 [Chryseobacterium aquaeductus]|uniref:DUF6759 domain-containing protein n=1 Tax=Chryseobacterium aquaeductus TaxID=2675056 RepID=A0A9N8MNL7_9FLAO|nr:DUF6759 domain-containing protein [Chryseobacterium aquaeductus]CAA7331177.1 hypothetical protein CHRY9390_01864 [Chryseobacterium potabilaquae]CAD7808640.1 hypothetical protein CHRY9390_01864 [Chryseobacterium aquaeductus]